MDIFTIDRVGGQGDGVAQTPSGPVFAGLTLPGETVRGVVVDGRLEEVEIITPSPDRIVPVSPQYGDCGGCSLLHWSEGPHLDWERRLRRPVVVALRFMPVAPRMDGSCWASRRAAPGGWSR